MKIKKIEKSRVKISNEIAWKEWRKYLDKVFKKLNEEIKVKGFRPGKAPREIIEQQVGKEAVLQQAGEEAVKKDLATAIEKENLAIIGRSEIKSLTVKEGEDLVYELVATVMPTIELANWRPAIKKINEKFSREKIEVADEEIDAELKKLAESRAKLITVNRSARRGDVAQVDFTVKKDGVVIENGTARNQQILLGSGAFIPGFEEEIVGMKEKEEKEFSLRFPEKYHEQNLAGQEAVFKVRMNLVQKRETPAVDDDFAKSLGQFTDLNDLRQKIKEGFQKEKEMQKKAKQRDELLLGIIADAKTDLPELLIEEEIHKIFHEFEHGLQQRGITMEQFEKETGKTKDDLEKEWRPQAESRIKISLAMDKLAEENEIKIKAEDIEAEMNKMLRFYGSKEEAEKKADLGRLYNYAEAMLRNEEVLKMLEKI